MDWHHDEPHGGVRERAGSIVGPRDTLPVVVWSPRDGREPVTRLILIGHGGSGDKREGYVVALARALVQAGGTWAVALDGPVHGDRRAPQGLHGHPLLDFAARWSSDEQLTDHAIEDWRCVLDAVLSEIGSDVQVGYWGLSMGTILGLPFVAAEPRVRAAVLGLMGLSGPTRERVERDAASITVPVLFVLQWDDALFPRDTALQLFDALGSTEKLLLGAPGQHAEVPSHNFKVSADFLLSRLTPPAD